MTLSAVLQYIIFCSDLGAVGATRRDIAALGPEALDAADHLVQLRLVAIGEPIAGTEVPSAYYPMRERGEYKLNQDMCGRWSPRPQSGHRKQDAL